VESNHDRQQFRTAPATGLTGRCLGCAVRRNGIAGPRARDAASDGRELRRLQSIQFTLSRRPVISGPELWVTTVRPLGNVCGSGSSAPLLARKALHSWWNGNPKWHWNYFPKLLRAHTVDCTVWEVQKLARPWKLKLHNTALIQLFRPLSSFCLKKEV
jgi:hypothetical protein